MIRRVGAVGCLAFLPDFRHQVDVAGLAAVPDPPPSPAAPPDLEPAVLLVGRGLLLGEEGEEEFLRAGGSDGPGLVAAGGLGLVLLPAGTLFRGLPPGGVPPGPDRARRRVPGTEGVQAVAAPAAGRAVRRIPAGPHDVAGERRQGRAARGGCTAGWGP